MSDYEKLLDNIYSNLPERTKHSGERFEPPKFDYFIEGNKTIIKNFKTVCEKLRRNPKLLLKFLTKELAVPGEIQGERMVLQRKVVGDTLEKKLMEFINKFVMCKECSRPDTNIQEVGRGMLIMICESCGARRTVKE
ncbi:MAG: translation initiation factor IF-2 subunit beta [Candidatus Bilamarchaeaceae archaeon]